MDEASELLLRETIAGWMGDSFAIDQMCERMFALACSNRLLILNAAMIMGGVRMLDLPRMLGVGRPTVSYHVRILVKAGFVEKLRMNGAMWVEYNPCAFANLHKQLVGK